MKLLVVVSLALCGIDAVVASSFGGTANWPIGKSPIAKDEA
jgi:hypothetical protein